MDLSVKPDGSTLHTQGYSQGRRKMSLNYTSQGEGGARSGGSPPYSSSNDTFPYGLSGVSMPNYGYPGDLYQFTSNGYPRKSRTCCYCGKVFTRSTTRRYHEKRCPLLRAAVCGIMPDNGKRPGGPGAGVTSGHSGHGVDKPSATSMTGGISHPSAPQLPTSHLSSHPSMVLKREQNGLGFHTSVIVKQENQDINGATRHAHTLGHRSGTDGSHDIDSSMTRLTPDSNGSSPRPPKLGDMSGFALSPYHGHGGLSFSKSPSQGSTKGDVNSLVHDEGEKDDDVKDDIENGSDLDVPDSETFQERMKDDEARANDLNFTSPGQGDALLLDGTTSNNLGDLTGTLSDDEKNSNDKSKCYFEGEAICGVCGKSFESSWQLHVHEQIHKKFKPYACRFCNQRFSKAALRIAHEREHITDDCNCAICGSTFREKESLRQHMVTRHRDGPWLCRYCGKPEVAHQEMADHLQSHDLPKEELLSIQFFLSAPLDNANNNDSDNNLNDSEINEVDNINDPELVSMSDSNDNMTSPDQQESPADNLAAVEQEMMSSAELLSPGDMVSSQDMMSQEKEMCTICGRDYPKSHMAYHMKAHEGHKPYECPICGKRFGYKNNMKSHIKLHAGIKPYQCNVCGAKFTRGSTLRRHARRHGISAESVWDLFVRNSSSSQMHSTPRKTVADVSHLTSSPTTLSTSKDLLTANGSYSNLFNTTTSAAMSNALLMSYHNHQAAVAASMPSFFSPLQSTSEVPPPALPGFTPSLSPQSDALNLSTHKSSSDGGGHPVDHLQHRSLVESISPTSVERSRSRSLSGGSDLSRPTLIPAAPSLAAANGNEIGIQVKMCCKMGLEPAYGNAQSPGGASVHSGDSGALYQAQSSSAGLENSTDSIATLMGSGRLFKCEHCECYFSEYAMYRIHTKIHSGGRTMPFLCPVCDEDCHDRVYFSLHISEHLR